MTHKILYGIFILILINSCSPRLIQEIGEPHKTYFSDLELYPDTEPNDLRIDIIRNSYATYINGILYNEEMPYHPLGFNLGNGLLYDLNGNLSIRIDYLLGISADHPFEIEENIKPHNHKRNTRYSYVNDTLIQTNLYQNRARYTYHKQIFGDSVVFMHKNRFKYAIVSKDSAVVYIWRNRKPEGIYQIAKNQFSLDKYKNKRVYEQLANQINLDKAYTLNMTDDSKAINIYSSRLKRKSRHLLTIEKSHQQLIIYTKRNIGKKIEFSDDGIVVYGPHQLITTYKLKGTPVIDDIEL